MTQHTHFGYQTISEDEKNQKVGAVFDSVAPNYDLMNDAMSLGLHRWWKHFAVQASSVGAGSRVLDVAGGSGDLSKLFANKVGQTGQVILTDINASMLARGRNRLLDLGIQLPIVQCDAEALPFEDAYFDCVIVGFGLRNMTHKETALQEMHRVLKRGGELLILEFSTIQQPLVKLYDTYSFKILPKLGAWLANDAASYQYLAESIRMHPNQESLKEMLEDCGFKAVRYHNLTAGIVALHIGYKF